MRRTTCGHWVHASCALWTPGTWINSETGLVEGLSKLPKVILSSILPGTYSGGCSYLQPYMYCIQCSGSEPNYSHRQQCSSSEKGNINVKGHENEHAKSQ